MIEKNNNYKKAFKELLEIIKYFPKNEYNKIPQDFIKFIEENMDTDYEYKVNHIDDFQNQEMLEETKILLSIVYRDFLVSEQDKKYIVELEKEEEKQEVKYNTNDLLRNRKEDIISKLEEAKEEHSIVEYKESFFQKIISKIKKIISKKE